MLLPVDLHPNAISDLNRLKELDPTGWAKVLALLQELKVNPDLQASMLNHDSYEEREDSRVNFQRWVEAHRAGSKLWRIKIYDLHKDVQKSPHRIIYGFHPWEQLNPRVYFLILAVVDRSFNYEIDSEYGQRVCQNFQEYCS